MSQQILLIARDETAFTTKIYSDILRDAGFRVIRVESLGRAIAMAFSLSPNLVILEQSFDERERTAFSNCLHEGHPEIPILFLQRGLMHPELLLKSCRNILAAQPGGRTVHSIQEFTAKSA